MTGFQKRVKEVLADSNVYPEKMVCKRNGMVEVKKSYFYRHGDSAEKLAVQVQKVLEAKGLEVMVDSRDDWAAWPKTSYFVAIVGN